MDFGVEQNEQQRSLWPFLLAGAVIVVLLFLVFGLLSRHGASHAPGMKALPFDAGEQSYAANVQFENLRMSRFANMFNQQVTYLVGDIYNGGNRAVGDLEVTVIFRDIQNHVVLQQTLRPMEPKPVPIQPGQRRAFQFAFDQVPDDWNMQYPTIQVTGLVLQ